MATSVGSPILRPSELPPVRSQKTTRSPTGPHGVQTVPRRLLGHSSFVISPFYFIEYVQCVLFCNISSKTFEPRSSPGFYNLKTNFECSHNFSRIYRYLKEMNVSVQSVFLFTLYLRVKPIFYPTPFLMTSVRTPADLPLFPSETSNNYSIIWKLLNPAGYLEICCLKYVIFAPFQPQMFFFCDYLMM